MSSDDHEVDLESMGEAVRREQKGQLVYDTGDARTTALSRVAGIRESCRGLVEAADAVSRQA